MKRKKGFTLLEVMISLLILATRIIGVMAYDDHKCPGKFQCQPFDMGIPDSRRIWRD